MEKVGKIYSLIPKVMKDIGAVKKEMLGTGYKARKIDDIVNALSDPLAKHGVFVIPEALEERKEERTSKNGNPVIFTNVKVRYTLFADDGSSVSGITIGEGMDTSDKSSNKAMTSAFKNFLTQGFVIPTEENKDSEQDSIELKAQKVQKAKEQNSKPANASKPASRPEVIDPLNEISRFGNHQKKRFKDIPTVELEKTLNFIELNNKTTEPAEHFKRNASAVIRIRADEMPLDGAMI